MFPKIFQRWLTFGICFGLLACLQQAPKNASSKSPLSGAEGTKAGAGVLALQEPEVSTLKRVRPRLLGKSLAKALNLNPQGMCLELGKIPCIDLVHKVALGGMNAYGNSQYQFPQSPGITSPIAFDRVILSACIQRAQIDLSNTAEAFIYKDLKLSIDGRLVKDAAIDAALDRLYQKAFLRDPSVQEREALKDLYEDIYHTEPNGAAINWMALSCYAVLSSVESVFY